MNAALGCLLLGMVKAAKAQLRGVEGALDLWGAVSNPFWGLVIRAELGCAFCAAQHREGLSSAQLGVREGLGLSQLLLFFPLFLGNIKHQHSHICCPTNYF